jgi:hypothetical protein
VPTSLDGTVKPADRHTVYTRFELRPTVEPIGACQYKLRVMQRKRVKRRTGVILPYFGHSAGFSRRESREQFLGLPFQLIKVGPLGKTPGG